MDQIVDLQTRPSIFGARVFTARSGLIALTATLSMHLGPAALAADSDEDDEMMEEVIVTGIRGSLKQAMDIKRSEDGVVDAISAEDIGKFPDANLAESLQRITGVSIDRQNNEGNQISVRGMGPSFNLVTLNGRQMPVSSSPEQETISSATQSRAFNFAEIASESVSSVYVYKTARANIPTGGMGATVDIRTARPFDFNRTQANFTVSGIHDTSVEDGDSVTPELGGLFSHKFNETFGVLVNGQFSNRNFTDRQELSGGWQVIEGKSELFKTMTEANGITGVDQLYRPITHISEIAEGDRERLNAQVVAQVRPSDQFTATLDYTLSHFKRHDRRYQTGLWGDPQGRDISNLTVDRNGTITRQTFTHANDFIFYENELVIENDSVGLNLDWQVNENLWLVFDFHSSQAESQPGGEISDLTFMFQGAQGVVFDITYGEGPPKVSVDDSDGGTLLNHGVPGALVNSASGEATELPMDHILDPDGLAPLGTVVRSISIDNTVTQFQGEGNWDFLSDGIVKSVDFGFSYTDYEVDTFSISSGFVFQGLGMKPDFSGVCDTEICPMSSPLRQQMTVGSGTGIDGGADIILRVDGPKEIASHFPIQLEDIQPGEDQSIITETSTALFVNVNFESEIGDMPARAAVGLRYEGTDVTGTQVQKLPLALRTSGINEQEVIFSEEEEDYTLEGDYAYVLPAVDLQIEPREDVVLRLSYGKTLARPNLNSLRPALTIADTRPNGPYNATEGNPNLEPYLADNFDLAVEWYYDDNSYMAFNFFLKQIDNYIGASTTRAPILNAEGNPLTDGTRRLVTDVGEGEAPKPVVGNASDPVATFNIVQPFNSGSADLNGFELALQHTFSDTGFGVQLNYTVVNSDDAGFDPEATERTVNLIGLSDSANLVGFYENDQLQVRLALNWRGDFLFSENHLRVQGEPIFFDAFTQIDLSVRYNFLDSYTAFVEILNLTGEDQLQWGRYKNQFLYQNDQDPRVAIGVSAKF